MSYNVELKDIDFWRLADFVPNNTPLSRRDTPQKSTLNNKQKKVRKKKNKAALKARKRNRK